MRHSLLAARRWLERKWSFSTSSSQKIRWAFGGSIKSFIWLKDGAWSAWLSHNHRIIAHDY